MTRHIVESTVMLLGIECGVEVHFDTNHIWEQPGPGTRISFIKVLNVDGKDILPLLSTPVAMDRAHCNIIGGKVYWYGITQADLLYGEIRYALDNGDIA